MDTHKEVDLHEILIEETLLDFDSYSSKTMESCTIYFRESDDPMMREIENAFYEPPKKD